MQTLSAEWSRQSVLWGRCNCNSHGHVVSELAVLSTRWESELTDDKMILKLIYSDPETEILECELYFIQSVTARQSEICHDHFHCWAICTPSSGHMYISRSQTLGDQNIYINRNRTKTNFRNEWSHFGQCVQLLGFCSNHQQHDAQTSNINNNNSIRILFNCIFRTNSILIMNQQMS